MSDGAGEGHDFDRATSVEPVGDGLWAGTIADGWDIHGNANGGYVMAIAARAMSAACAREHPVSVTMHYLSPATPGPVAVRTAIARDGGRLASVSATIERNGTAIAAAIGLFSRSAAASGPDRHLTPATDRWTRFDACPARPSSAAVPELMRRLDVRIEPADAGFVTAPSGRALLRGWFAFADDRSNDALALLLAADVFPPVAFNVVGEIGWMPTLELTVHVRGVPTPGPLRCEFTSSMIGVDSFDENGRIWDSSGRCVATSRQIALLPRSTPPAD